MQCVKVELGSRSYEILIGEDLLPSLGGRCRSLKLGERCAVITDANVGPRFAGRAAASLRAAGFSPVIITLPAGEKTKSMKWAGHCFETLASHRLERKSFVVALGGGVVGDLAGYVASGYLRGIPFVQIPTTLLAQVDSSVGGKTGVNLKAGKNLVGAFHQPRLVLCDLSTLKKLPRLQLSCGLAEVVKYGVIYDAAFFGWLEKNIDAALRVEPEILARIVARSCEIKAEVVSQDETETGLRAILNFGHTLGHAIENVFQYKMFHGQAISIGQVLAARLSERLLGLPGGDAERIASLLKRAKLPVQLKLSPQQKKKVMAAMKLDKKVSQGEVKFVLARKIGVVEFGRKVSEAEIAALLGA